MAFLPNSYADRTSRPIYALIFLLGFLLLYLLGLVLIQPDLLRQSLAQPQGQVVAFYWVRAALQFLGFTPFMSWYAAPLVVIVILLALQATSQTSWRVKPADLLLMAGECVLLSIPLIVMSLMMNKIIPQPNTVLTVLNTATDRRLLVDIVAGIGAGIYEELIFRLILICILMLIFQDILGFKTKTAVITSVIIAALLFSIHHHYTISSWRIVATNDPLTLSKFLFRTLAGVYFAGLYAIRGFGITAGTHAFYNILAALMRILVFSIDSP